MLKNLLWALRYPSFVSPSNIVGEYAVGAIQTRIPPTASSTDNHNPQLSPSCQIHYPTLPGTSATTDDGDDDDTEKTATKHPYFRPQAVQGMANYTRQSAPLLEFLSQRSHPCNMNAPPIPDAKFPIVIVSHGLGGCMEMYTELCQQIASQGYWVLAVEHGDGSGAYAETPHGEPIYYQRPPDAPAYSREKVVHFRKPFLQHRVQEIQTVLDFIFSLQSENNNNNNNNNDNELVRKVFDAADTKIKEGTTQGQIHLLGHSFGGATMVLASQDAVLTSKYSIQSLALCDCWAFSLDEPVLERGIRDIPTLSLLSEAWVTNPETRQVQQLLQNSSSVLQGSYFVPHSVHTSFSDATHWLPGFATRRMQLRGIKEHKHETIRTTALACVEHMATQQSERRRITDNTEQDDAVTTETTATLLKKGKLQEFPV